MHKTRYVYTTAISLMCVGVMILFLILVSGEFVYANDETRGVMLVQSAGGPGPPSSGGPPEGIPPGGGSPPPSSPMVSETTIQSLIQSLTTLVTESIVPIAFGLGTLMFFYGIARYVFNAGSKEEKVTGKHIMTWGVVVMFIMSAIWGIIAFLQRDIGIENRPFAPTNDENPFE